MQTQPTVSFDGVAVDDAVRDAALGHVDKLESFCRDIIGCHVVLSQPHRHPRRGRLWSVRIDLVVPGVDIIVNRTHCRDQAHEDPLVALRDAFRAAERRLEEHVRERRGETKTHVPHDEGRILRVLPEEGYGFIATADGREIYFHAHALSECGLCEVVAGMPVRFTVEDGDDGPQATWVHVTAPGGPSRTAPGPAAPPSRALPAGGPSVAATFSPSSSPSATGEPGGDQPRREVTP